MSAWYNEIEPKMAAALRVQIERGQIAPGIVDERSIEDVAPAELVEFTQCHFFAGLGVFSRALRAVGWRDEWEIWTGSCPCQPFSGAGKGVGFADKRHLWPAFFWHIRQRRPVVVVGEQVAGPRGEAWIDHVSTDLEGADYAVGAVSAPSCGFGAPTKRGRLYWMARALEYAGLVPDAGGRDARVRVGGPWPVADPAGGECEAGPKEPASLSGVRSDGEDLHDPRGPGQAHREDGPVASAADPRLEGDTTDGERAHPQFTTVERDGGPRNLADADCERRDGEHTLLQREEPGRVAADMPETSGYGEARDLADPAKGGRECGTGPCDSEPGGERGNVPADSSVALARRVGDTNDHAGRADEPGRGPDRGAAPRRSGQGGGLPMGDASEERSAPERSAAPEDGPANPRPIERGELPARVAGPGQMPAGLLGLPDERLGEGSMPEHGLVAELCSPLPAGVSAPGPCNGFWADCEWVLCRDPSGLRARPVRSGSFPLVVGAPARTGRLSGYGNSLSLPHTTEFLRAAKAELEELALTIDVQGAG